MRYKFYFRYKTYANELHDYPVILTATSDLVAYRLAVSSFIDRIEYLEKALHIKFAAPENLTIIMRKELP